MARPRKFKTSEDLELKWDEYKNRCNNIEVLTHNFSSKNSEFVSAKLRHSVTYTIEGFCVYAGISRQAFHEHYSGNKKFTDVVVRIREECEADAREKFELGIIPTQLAGLWMSKYGYTTKQEVNAEVKTSEKLSDILNQLGDDGLEE